MPAPITLRVSLCLWSLLHHGCSPPSEPVNKVVLKNHSAQHQQSSTGSKGSASQNSAKKSVDPRGKDPGSPTQPNPRITLVGKDKLAQQQLSIPVLNRGAPPNKRPQTVVPRAKCTVPRPVTGPSWETQKSDRSVQNQAKLLENQMAFLMMFREASSQNDWNRIHHNHFDWWQFPCDFGSKKEFNLKSEQDISALRSNVIWHERYRESVRLVARAFGWDVDSATMIDDGAGGAWREDKDIRLAKMIRSLWLFGESDYFESLQQFAQHIHSNIYGGGSFFYGSQCLDDMLALTLPRPIPFST